MAHQPLEDRGRGSERRVGHHAERTTREAQVGRVGLHDRDRAAAEAVAENPSTSAMELDGDDARTACRKPCGQRTGAGADVEDEVAGADAGVSDEALGPPVSESMPSPVRPALPGHDAP